MKIEINFEPKNESFKECIHRTVYGCGRKLKHVAEDIEMSPSELSRKLADNPNDPVHFPAHKLPELIKATNGLDIVYWLINEFLRDKKKEKEQAIEQLLALVPKLKPLIAAIEENT